MRLMSISRSDGSSVRVHTQHSILLARQTTAHWMAAAVQNRAVHFARPGMRMDDQNCEGYRTAVFTDLRVKTKAHKEGPTSRLATPTPPGHLLGTPWAPQDH